MTLTAQTDRGETKRQRGLFHCIAAQLIWARFKKQRAAMIAAMVLVFLILSGLFAPFLSPYDPTIAGRDKDYTNGAPQIPQFCDSNGCSLRPFIHGVDANARSRRTFAGSPRSTRTNACYVSSSSRGDEYKLFGFIPGNVHLFGVEGARSTCSGPMRTVRISSREPSTRSGPRCKSAPSAC